jgi:PAS domain S-box-containing protein
MAAGELDQREPVSRAMLRLHEQYVRLLDAHADGMLVLDKNQLIVYANTAAERLLGMSQTSLRSRPWVFESGGQGSSGPLFPAPAAAGLTVRREPVLWQGAEATLVILQDATQCQADAILRTVTDAMQIAVLRFDRTLRCCYASSNVAVMLDIAPTVVLNKNSYGLNLAPRVAARVERTLHDVFASGAYRQIDIEFPTLDAYNVYETHFVAEPDSSGTIAAVLIILQDTTRRRQLERDLQESRRFAQQLADSLPGLVYIYDLGEDRTIYANSTFSSLLGYSTESIRAGAGGLMGALMHPDDATRWTNQIAPRYATIGSGAYIENEFRIRHADGRWYWFLCREIVWRRTPEGLPEQVLGIAQDISVRKAIEGALADERSSLARRVAERTAELSAANLELAQAARLKDEFLASMSHELRTPLQAILGLAENMEQGMAGPLTEKQVRYVQIILESGQHLLSLINDILEFSRIESGRFEPDLAPTSVTRICESSLRLVREQALRKELSITFEIDEKLGGIEADERMLKQILINLLGNAVKFTTMGGSVGLEAMADAEQGIIRFTVWDTGIGIAGEDLLQLFRPFVQLEAGLNRQFPGTGLGLALVARLVRLHNGTISIESVKDQGSRFSFVIPWLPVGATTMRSGSDSLKSRAIQRSLEKLRASEEAPPTVLLIEDAVMIVEALTTLFVEERCELVTARSGQEGLAMARQLHPALILVDVRLPDLDDIESALQLLRDPAVTGRPVIAITSLLLPGERERLLEGGFEDVKSLPLTQREVALCCNTYIGQRTLTQ